MNPQPSIKNTHRCLYCYQPLQPPADFHEKCSKKFFGTAQPPLLDYDSEQMEELAKDIVVKSVAITGVQPKLSLTIEKTPGDPKNSRLTIVGLWGKYILKPPTEEFPYLPENEDLTMHLSDVFGFRTAEHSLIRLKSGELSYLTKRFDRIRDRKLAMEDMCQLTETLTEDKYRSSMEKVGKQIAIHSSRPGLDLVDYFELSLFCFITGNADMHLKNFALLTTEEKEIILTPAYDLLCTKLVMPDDKEDMALTINGRKNKIRKKDFDALAHTLGIPEKAVQNVYGKLPGKVKEAIKWINISFLPENMKHAYIQLVQENLRKLEV